MQQDLFSQDLQTHSHERSETESFFQENKKKFSANLQKTFDLLMAGETLTYDNCINVHQIGSVSSRCSELKKAGFFVTKGWEKDLNDKRISRRYYFTPQQIEEYKIRFETLVK